MEIMETIEYGFKDKQGNNILIQNPLKWENEFYKFYYLQTPEELLESKCGVCWCQVELERYLFFQNHIPCKTYFIYAIDDNTLPSHTFLTFQKNDKYYWFEHSWESYKGIHEYESEKKLLLEVKKLFQKEHNYDYIYIYEYQTPKFHITCNEFYQYIETQKIIKTNTPLYFYHLVDKNADMSKGLLSLQYMYDHKMDDIFEKNVEKYKERITTSWNIKKYQGKPSLTKEECLDALNMFRGKNGSNMIYFFRYPPFKKLGKKIAALAQYKDIYRININDEELEKLITEIFYGYDESYSDNKVLDKKYYETVTKEEYFARYDDTIMMNFSRLNHIGISFKDGYCPLKFLEKVDWN